MATFKVGQRVRVTSVERRYYENDRWLLEQQGTVTGYGFKVGGGIVREYKVAIDGQDDPFGFDACHLAPLTDPRADEFIADMERFSIAAQKTKVKA